MIVFVPIDFNQIRRVIQGDKILSKVMFYIEVECPQEGDVDAQLRLYTVRKNELNVENGVILLG